MVSIPTEVRFRFTENYDPLRDTPTNFSARGQPRAIINIFANEMQAVSGKNKKTDRVCGHLSV